MAVIPSLYDNIATLVDSLVYNPSKRFITAGDIQNYVNLAAIDVATELGGINYIDLSNLSVANQRDYTPNNTYLKIKTAQYITGLNTPSEVATPLDIITQPDDDFLARISLSGGVPDNASIYVAGVPQNVPKYLIYWPETNTLRLIDTPINAGDTLKLWVLGLPNALTTGVQYDGNPMELLAIVFKVCSLARLKSRETNESTVFDTKYSDQITKIRRLRSKQRQVRQIQDGRFGFTRLRSVNGAK